jgi:hypothetical protein
LLLKPETIQFPVELKLLSREDEMKIIQQGGGCEEKEPIAFLSRPGLDSKHRTALIYIGTACYDMEHSSCLLLQKKSCQVGGVEPFGGVAYNF